MSWALGLRSMAKPKTYFSTKAQFCDARIARVEVDFGRAGLASQGKS